MKKTAKSLRALALLMALLLLVLAGCGGGGGQNSGNNGGGQSNTGGNDGNTPDDGGSGSGTGAPKTLTIAIGEQYAKDQIKSCWTEAGGLLFTSMFSALMKLDENSQPTICDLAESYEILDDGMKAIFTIRDGVTWHDGTPFTAEDFVWSAKAALRTAVPPGGIGPFKKCIGGKAYAKGESDEFPGLYTDGNKVVMEFEERAGALLSAMTQFRPLPKHLLENEDVVTLHTNTFWQAPVGTGPYKFKEFVPGSYIVVEAYDGYYGPQPGIPEIQYMVYDDTQSEAAFMNGDIALYSVDSYDKLQNILAQNSDIIYQEMPDSIYFRFLTPNLTGRDGNGNPLIEDIRVREAIYRAIDKKSICEDLFSGSAAAMTSLVPPNRSEYDPTALCPEYDLEKAKELLDEAGFDYSKTITIAYFYNDRMTIDALDVVKYNLEQLGLKVELKFLSGDLTSLIYDVRDYDFIYQGLSTTDVMNIYNLHGKEQLFAQIIGTEYTDSWTPLIKAYNQSMDLEGKLEAIKALQHHENETLEMFPLWSYTMYELINSKLVDIPIKFQSSTLNYEKHFELWHLVG